MLRIVLGVVAGFVSWVIVWFVGETILSVMWPSFGEHQAAFQAAIEAGPRIPHFYSDSTFLAIHCVLASIVSLLAGLVSAFVAGENKRAPLIVGLLLLALGLLKAVTSWPLVPIWYHILFTAILLPLTIAGATMKYRP